MLLPTTYTATMLMLALAAVCLGGWWSVQKANRTWRFEFAAADFAIGALLMALALGLTLGNSGNSNSFTFEDNLTVGSKRNMATAFAGGAIFCVGNVMVMAGMAVAGMSTALPAAAAVAMLVAVGLAGGVASPGLAYGGAGVAMLALAVLTIAQKAAAAAAPAKRGMHPGWKGFILSTIGGLFAGAGCPVAEMSRGGDIGLGAYGSVVLMMAGMLTMTPLLMVYFLNLPVQGEAGSPLGYFRGKLGEHGLGLASGFVFAIGMVALFSGSGGTFAGAPPFLSLEAGGYAGAALGAGLGLTVWKEQAESPRAKGLAFVAAGLLLGAAALIFLGA